MRVLASARWRMWLVSASLLLESLLVVPLAVREYETTSVLAIIANEGWTAEARRATEAAAQGVMTLLWVHLVLGGLLVLLAIAIYLRPAQWMFGAAALAGAYSAAVAIWFLLGTGPAVGRALPAGVLVLALTAVAGMAAVGCLFGWEATAPAEPRRPVNPPVPPSHQAG